MYVCICMYVLALVYGPVTVSAPSQVRFRVRLRAGVRVRVREALGLFLGSPTVYQLL